MKKLFFFAAVALVAIGGAANAALYELGTNNQIPCGNAVAPSCASVTGKSPNTQLSTRPFSSGLQTNDAGIVADYTFQP